MLSDMPDDAYRAPSRLQHTETQEATHPILPLENQDSFASAQKQAGRTEFVFNINLDTIIQPLLFGIAGVGLAAAITLVNPPSPEPIAVELAAPLPSAQQVAAAYTTLGAMPQSEVLGIATASADASDSATSTSSAELTKDSYTIALIGDSMIDTFDSSIASLSAKLEEKYSKEFKVYNYGVGSENVQKGLERFDKPLTYKDRNYPSIPELKPDVILIGSFAYNPFETHDINQYWLSLAQLVETAQKITPNVYLIADVAPLKEDFGKKTLDWNTDVRVKHASHISEQLQSSIALSQTLSIPILDLYTPTKAEAEDLYGDGTYTREDGIHPNQQGQDLLIENILENVTFE